MTKFMEWPDDRIDVLVGGTPCQSFSIAGLRRGLADLVAVLHSLGIRDAVVSGSRVTHSGGKRWVESVALEALPFSSTTLRDALSKEGAQPPGLTVSAMAYIKKNRLYAVRKE
jgi:hypothetical protein